VIFVIDLPKPLVHLVERLSIVANASSPADTGFRPSPTANVIEEALKNALWAAPPNSDVDAESASMIGTSIPRPSGATGQHPRDQLKSAPEACRQRLVEGIKRGGEAAATAPGHVLPETQPRLGRPDDRRPAIALIASGGHEASSLEAADEATRGGQADPDPAGHLAHPAAVGLGDHYEDPPLRQGELARRAHLPEHDRRQADGRRHEPFQGLHDLRVRHLHPSNCCLLRPHRIGGY
jgi:hypothetical protein